jgi:hypothetical protein
MANKILCSAIEIPESARIRGAAGTENTAASDPWQAPFNPHLIPSSPCFYSASQSLTLLQLPKYSCASSLGLSRQRADTRALVILISFLLERRLGAGKALL